MRLVFHVAATGQLTVENTTIAKGDGMRLGGGGLLVNGGQVALIGSTVTGNVADLGVTSLGAGILNLGGSLIVDMSTLAQNGLLNDAYSSGPSSGGAIAVVNGTATITRSTLSGNRSEHVAGIHSIGESSTVTVLSTAISGNAGRAVFNEGSIWLTDVEMSSNQLEDFTGGFVSKGSASLERVTFEDHESDYPGALVNSGTMELRDSYIRNNFAGTIAGKGSIYNSGIMEIAGTQIVGNVANDASGGGISNSGTLTIRDSHVANNRASEPGGGIFNTGHLDLFDSVVAGNRVGSRGGGIYNRGRMYLFGSTSIGTRDDGNYTNGEGGGIFAESPSYTFVCSTCTVTGNVAYGHGDEGATPGAGIYANGASLELSDPSSVFGNTPDQVVQLKEVDQLGSLRQR